MKLVAMEQYRKGLVQEGAGKNQAKDANHYLFRALHPDHVAIEKANDKATKSAARDDWTRLSDRLREGKLWLDIRDLFGGVGAFLALRRNAFPTDTLSGCAPEILIFGSVSSMCVASKM
jgi:hypothetical protein